MEITEDARKMIDKRTNAILKGIDVPEREKQEIRRELVSNYIDAATEEAMKRGASAVERRDVVSALETSSDPDEIASMYMASYVRSLKRVGVWPRLAAGAIDTVMVLIATLMIASPIVVLRIFWLFPRQVDRRPESAEGGW